MKNKWYLEWRLKFKFDTVLVVNGIPVGEGSDKRVYPDTSTIEGLSINYLQHKPEDWSDIVRRMKEANVGRERSNQVDVDATVEVKRTKFHEPNSVVC